MTLSDLLQRPEFITFTGVDSETDTLGMQILARRFPIEWGVLFSTNRQGTEPRYMRIDQIRALVTSAPGLRYAAHLCGVDAREVIDSGESRHDGLLFDHFTRVQINTARSVNTLRMKAFGDGLSLNVIVQTRDAFPVDPNVEWLFDQSGGRGIEASSWPAPLLDRRVGFAGGLRPANVMAAVRAISPLPGQRYWLDMESGVRDADDRFSLSMCQAVCEAVFEGALL